MRPFFTASLSSLVLFMTLAAYGQLVANSRYLARASITFREWAKTLPQPPESERLALIGQAQQRAMLYDDEINRTHLVDGMLVNRSAGGFVLDQCDSLLFSSLRFAALNKLGLEERATRAWRAIETSQSDGHWRRHPRCPNSTSRDMLVGVLIAMSQRPDGFQGHLQTLIERVGKHDGYFSTGPVYVSYLTPGVAKLIDLVASDTTLDKRHFPDIIKTGYSTSELQVTAVGRGYQAHLVALSVWLEMELATPGGPTPRPGRIEQALAPFVAPFSSQDLQTQRIEWTTHHLVRLDPRNLFFRYLRLRSVGALNPTVAHNLLTELMEMKQFPEDRLPMNCDRRADYMWQRASREFEPARAGCTRQFNGADFLWMAALLLESARGEGYAYTEGGNIPNEIDGLLTNP